MHRPQVIALVKLNNVTIKKKLWLEPNEECSINLQLDFDGVKILQVDVKLMWENSKSAYRSELQVSKHDLMLKVNIAILHINAISYIKPETSNMST